MDASNTTPAVAMEDDGTPSNRAESDHGAMEEDSDADWDQVASGSEDYGNDDQQDEETAADDDDDDDGGDDEDDEERDLIILCSMSLGRWERHEAAVEAAAEAEAGKQALSSAHGVAARRQIFNPREAFSMLSRELLDFLRGRHMDCSVETVGDDLYHWIVDLGSFAEGSPLAKDMREVSRRYFYSTVRLRLRFMRGLHPFFPPSVEVVWPHLAAPLLGAVASHPMLRLENWDPWRPAMETVAQIKAFLEAHARVELDNPANDIRRHPHSTYSSVERTLARLEALSGVSPACLARPEVAGLYAARDSFDKDAARLQALAEGGKKRSRPEPAGAKRSREVVWARGTGYGSGNDKGAEQWDAKATEAAQRARDSEIQVIVDDMSCSVVRELGPRPPLRGEAKDAAQQPQQQQQSKEELGEGKEQEKQQEGAVSVSDKASGAGPAGEGGGGAAAAAGGPEAMEGVETSADAGEAAAAAAPAGEAADVAAGASAAAAAAEGCGAGDAGVSGSGGADASEPLLGSERCAALLRDSCLLPFLVRELQGASFTDMGARHKYYTALLVLLRELCRPSTHDMLWAEVKAEQGPGEAAQGVEGPSSSSTAAVPGRSVAAILTTGLRSAAKIYINVLRPSTVKTEKSAAAAAAAASTSTTFLSSRLSDRIAAAAENAAKEAEATVRLAKIIMQVAAYIEASAPPLLPPAAAEGAAAATAAAGSQQPQAAAAPAAVASAAAAAADGKRAASGAQASTSGAAAAGVGGPSLYLTTLRPLQVDAVSGLSRAHHYSTNVGGEQQAPRTRTVRLAKEVASLESLLPLSESSSVFVRVDETAVQLWKAIVVGPEDTPYSGGCFVFDIYFPPQYPNVPPQVHLMTTGGGRVRFNPNLYAEGKVCLSLLGTWSGDRGENWSPDVSTAVQVLISIQSLILVPEPYFNEPSYEVQTDERGKTASQEYNKNIREQCVRYAMLDVLRHPPAALADAVRAHFRLRRGALLGQIKAWADEASAADAPAATRLMELREELEALIATV